MNIVPKYKLSQNLINELTKKIDSSIKNIKIADIGCGNKPYEKQIRKKLNLKKIEYIGFDFSGNDYDFKIDMNQEKIPLQSNSIDIVICTEVLEHLYNPNNALKEIRRIIKPNGILFLTSPFMFPIHEVKHDYHRYTHNFYRNYFENDIIIKEVISNTALSFPLYVINYYYGQIAKTNYKIVGILQKPLDYIALKILKNRVATYSYYMDIGYLIKMRKNNED